MKRFIPYVAVAVVFAVALLFVGFIGGWGQATPTISVVKHPHPAHVGAKNLSTFSVVSGDEVEYALLFAGNFNSSSSFTRNPKTRTWTDKATLSIDDLEITFQRNHEMPDQLTIGDFSYILPVGRVFIIDTITPQPDAPWQIIQIDADIPVITQENIERVFEIAHQPDTLSTATVSSTGEYPQGSGQLRTIEMYSRHDKYRTRFALFHSTNEVDSDYNEIDSDYNGSNNPHDGSWEIDDMLHLDGGRDYRLQCSSNDADSLRINSQKFDLNDGRVIVVNDDGTLTQFPEFPRVISDTAEMLSLYDRINP